MPAVFSQPDLLAYAWVGLSLFLLGMGKGGFPVGGIALPLLILIWPERAGAARAAVAFMLPLLCAMDVVAVLIYRRHILWDRIKPLVVGTLAGVLAGSVLFVFDESALLSVSDRALKLCIGSLGLVFVCYSAASRWISRSLEAARPTRLTGALSGVAAGVTSTLAHAAGPVIQMYLLPQRLPKLQFAATTAAFFFFINLVKLVPFILAGRIEREGLALGALMLPVIPVGVLAGYVVVRATRQRHYMAFIYVALTAASLGLIFRALNP